MVTGHWEPSWTITSFVTCYESGVLDNRLSAWYFLSLLSFYHFYHFITIILLLLSFYHFSNLSPLKWDLPTPARTASIPPHPKRNFNQFQMYYFVASLDMGGEVGGGGEWLSRSLDSKSANYTYLTSGYCILCWIKLWRRRPRQILLSLVIEVLSC